MKVDADLATVGDLAADQEPGQPVTDGGLDQAAQRPGAVRRVVAGLGEPGTCGVGDLDRDPADSEAVLEQ